MSELPQLKAVTSIGGYRLRLRYSDGFVGEVDFADTVARGGTFAFMRKLDRFAAVKVAHGGTSVQWIDDAGDEIDFDAYAQRMIAEANAIAVAPAK